jgi:CelD/BcsL family acetyltransferase involved in cellulose biosynthesis
MEVQIIDSVDQFLAIEGDWDALHQADTNASIFQGWEWNYHWWRHYGAGNQLQIIVVRQNGIPKAVLPLYLQRNTVLRYWQINCLRFIGTGGDTSPDYLGPIQDAATAAETSGILAACVLEQLGNWHVLSLSDMNRDSLLFAELDRECRRRGLGHSECLSARIAYAELPATWDDYLASVHRGRRNTIRRLRKKVETQHRGRFHVVRDKDEVDEVLNSLIDLHKRRWRGHPDGHAFSTPEYVGFHRDVIKANAERDRIRFYRLEADGKDIAVFYCYRYRNQVLYFQAGFDPAYERLRPGLVLTGFAFEDAIMEGNSVFDFLRGNHAYKTQWGKSSRETHALTVWRSGISRWMHYLLNFDMHAIKRRATQRIPFLPAK